MVTADVTSRVTDQHPQVETADATELDRPFLGGAIPATPRPLTLSRLPDGWSIDSGAVHGVPEPIGDDTTELAVYPLTGETSGSPLATALVTKVLPDRSLVRLTPELDEAYVYRAVVTSIPLEPLLVGVVGDATGTAALRTAADDADETLVDLVEGATGPARHLRTSSSRPPRTASSSPVPASRAPSCPSSRARRARSAPSSPSSAWPAGCASPP